MRGESFQNAMAGILVAVLFAVVPLLLNAWAEWFLYLPALAAIALAGFVFLREVDLAAPHVLPQEPLRFLADRLGEARHSARPSRGGLTVRIGPVSAVRLRARVTDRGTVVSYQTHATPMGGVLVLVLIALLVTSVPALVVLVYLHGRAKRFARERVGGVLQEQPAPPPVQDEIRMLLVGSLSEGERLARQAYEAQRSSYWDALLDIGLAGFLAWVSVLIGLFVAMNGFNLLTGRWEIPLLGATSVAVALGVGIGWIMRGRYRARMDRYEVWADRLGTALARELSARAPEPAEPSAFEVLAAASQQAPDWIEGQRSAGMSADPTAGFVLLFLSSLAFSVGSNAVVSFAQGFLVSGLVFTVPAVGLGIGAALYARHWRRLQEEHLARRRLEWETRTRILKDRMNHLLEEM